MPRSASESPNRSPTLSSLVTRTQLVPRLITAPTTNATTARPIPTGLRTPRHRPAGAPTKREGRTDDDRPRSPRRLLPRTDNAPTRLPGSPSQILDAQQRLANPVGLTSATPLQVALDGRHTPNHGDGAVKLSSAKGLQPGLHWSLPVLSTRRVAVARIRDYNVTTTPDEVPRTSMIVGKVCAAQSEYRRTLINDRNDQINLLIPRCRVRAPGGPLHRPTPPAHFTGPLLVVPTRPVLAGLIFSRSVSADDFTSLG